MQYFYHQSIKNYTIALLDMFNDIKVPRYHSDGTLIDELPVPIKFGNRDKAYILSDTDIENLLSGNTNTLPRMVLEFNSMTKAPMRDTNKKSKINKIKKENTTFVDIKYFQYNAVAYDFNFTIYLATRTFTDATIVIEQIAPMFRPDITLKIYEMDIQEEPTSVPVQLGDFNIELPTLSEREVGIIETSFTLTVKGNLYLPVKEEKIIKDLIVNTTIVESERQTKTDLYEIDPSSTTQINVPASKIESTPKSEITDDSQIPEAREDANVEVIHYSNSGDKFSVND